MYSFCVPSFEPDLVSGVWPKGPFLPNLSCVLTKLLYGEEVLRYLFLLLWTGQCLHLIKT